MTRKCMMCWYSLLSLSHIITNGVSLYKEYYKGCAAINICMYLPIYNIFADAITHINGVHYNQHRSPRNIVTRQLR